MNWISLFSVPISITSRSSALALIGEWLLAHRARMMNDKFRIPNEKRRRRHSSFRIHHSEFPKIILTPNPEIIVAAQKDPALLKALQSADLAIPDGIGVVWALRLLRPKAIPLSLIPYPLSLSRLSGIDLMESLILQPQKVRPFEPKLKILLLGGRPGVAQTAAAALRRKFRIQNSEFRIKSLSGPQIIESISKSENDRLITQINSFRPDLLFVAFGHPRQEKWLMENRERLTAGVAMAVGGALDQIADPGLRPPAYINSIGLGWLYRLLRQPWRWRRQLALFKFIGMVVKEKIKNF